MVAAKAGVPANASFIGVEGGRALPTRQQAFAHLAHCVLTGLAVGAVQHKDAVEVVYLVLEDPCEAPLSLDTQRRSRQVLAPQDDGERPFDLHADSRNREAALYVLLLSLGSVLDHRVDDDKLPELSLVLVGGNEDALETSDLVGGEAGAFGLVHDPLHVLRQLF